jgi:putative hydrolase of the HAD superfamily
VTFDCWRTLLVETDWSAAHARRVGALVEAAEQAGRSVTSEVARRVFDEAWNEHMLAWRQGVATGAPEVARAALEAVGIATEGPHFDALVAQWQEASHSGRVRAVEGAREALERIAAAGIPRALVCDTGLTPGHAVRGLLEAQGLLGLLDVCVFSDEIGVPKPADATFRAALAAFDVVAVEAIHVGDLLRTDVAGARALGMGTIRLRAIYDDPDPLPEADAVADGFDEVLELLALS